MLNPASVSRLLMIPWISTTAIFEAELLSSVRTSSRRGPTLRVNRRPCDAPLKRPMFTSMLNPSSRIRMIDTTIHARPRRGATAAGVIGGGGRNGGGGVEYGGGGFDGGVDAFSSIARLP